MERPAATYLESEDVVRSYGTYPLQFLPVVIEPQGEAWSNRRLAQELARRLDLADPVFSMGTKDLLRALFRGAPGPPAAPARGGACLRAPPGGRRRARAQRRAGRGAPQRPRCGDVRAARE